MKKAEKPPMDPELKRRIQELIDYKGGGFNQESVADIIENALKLLKDVQDSGDVRVIQTALRELRFAFKLFAPYAHVRKVTMFGSARTQPTRPEYQQAVEFGRKIAAAGFMVITGAGPGIMQAGHEGAGPEKSFGANIRLPWEQSRQPGHSRGQEAGHLQVFLHPQADLHPALGRHRAVPGRVRHDGRGLRGADPDADGQEPVDAAGAD